MTALAVVSTLAWLYLAVLHGRFWQAGPVLPRGRPRAAPPVVIVVPARDEAEVIAPVIVALLAQDYAGEFRVVLVDDNSSDGTAEVARGVADPRRRLTVLTGAPRPPGWAGKLWAVSQGTAATTEELILLTDADIVHEAGHLATLVAGMERIGAAMVSEMVRLNCTGFAERALVPAFVYFFAMLYPFARVNDPRRVTAAAAGGTILIRRQALARIGGIAAIKGALIDDVALACAVKPGAAIWLGHSGEARSIRRYVVAEIWRMIARSAYVQLGHSPLLLVGTVMGMGLLFVVPMVTAIGAPAWFNVAWYVSMASFLPAARRYGFGVVGSVVAALALPFVALFYVAATVAAAFHHHGGRGVVWKSRAYQAGRA